MVDWGGNYPPGAKNDPKAPYNEPDHSHEHEWRRDTRKADPAIEDGAAIFQDECAYREGPRGEAYSCNKTRTYRFEYSTLESRNGSVWQLSDVGSKTALEAFLWGVVIEIEEAYHNTDEVEINVDPDPDAGQVTLKHDGWTLTYE